MGREYRSQQLEINYDSKNESRKYEKPIIEKQGEMTFPTDIIESSNGGRLCVQCSGCHGCR